jgi:hypothetical protein
LNEVLAGLLDGQHPGTVTVIDYSDAATLEQKAPALWAILSGLRGFDHVQMSSDEAMSELRTEFSKVWVRKLMIKGGALYEDGGAACPAEHLACPDLSVDDLYDLRRDAEGTSYATAARQKEPSEEASRVAYARMVLRDAGAQLDGAWLRLNDQTFRVVNGRGRPLSKIKLGYNEPPSIRTADFVVCTDSFNGGTPSNIVLGNGGGKSITGPSIGGSAQWVTWEEAQQALEQ